MVQRECVVVDWHLFDFVDMITTPPKVDPTGRYSVMETCALLQIHRNTLQRYTESLAIRCHIRKATGRKYYCGKDIAQFWAQNY